MHPANLSNERPAAVQPLQGSAPIPQAVAQPAPRVDSIESHPASNAGSIASAGLRGLGNLLLGAGLAIVSAVVALVAGLCICIGNLLQRLSGTRPAQQQADPFAHIREQIISWMPNSSGGIFEQFQFPCKFFAVVKIYPPVPSQASPIEFRLRKRYESREEAEHENTYTDDIAHFAAEVLGACRMGNFTRQNRVEMVLIATHKEDANNWHFASTDRQFPSSFGAGGNSSSGICDRSVFERMILPTIRGLDPSMLNEILHDPAEPREAPAPIPGE
ncbi:MAG: hypothetical protein ACHQT8_06435 [Chlamydiales bacterium]